MEKSVQSIDLGIFLGFFKEYSRGRYGTRSLGMAFTERFPVTNGFDSKVHYCLDDTKAFGLILQRYKIANAQVSLTAEVQEVIELTVLM